MSDETTTNIYIRVPSELAAVLRSTAGRRGDRSLNSYIVSVLSRAVARDWHDAKGNDETTEAAIERLSAQANEQIQLSNRRLARP
jgi:hypothetical protein